MPGRRFLCSAIRLFHLLQIQSSGTHYGPNDLLPSARASFHRPVRRIWLACTPMMKAVKHCYNSILPKRSLATPRERADQRHIWSLPISRALYVT